jgi:hypothetical protein
MSGRWRLLLWILVVVLPGGLLLLPILAADAARRRTAQISPAGERVSLVPERPSWVEDGRRRTA